jgi:hypothetical protein
VLILSVIPQQVFFYDQLLLYHVPHTRHEMQVLLVTGWAALIGALLIWDFHAGLLLIVAGLYLPALALLLSRRWTAERRGGAPGTSS